MSDTAKLEKEHGVSYEDLLAQNRKLENFLSAMQTHSADPMARRLASREDRELAYKRRLAAPKRPYRYSGRSARVRLARPEDALPAELARQSRLSGPALRNVVRGERLLFDPADDPEQRGEREFHYGQRIDLSDLDREALEKAGYLFVPLDAPQEVPDDDHLGGAYKALEEDDYNEACRILRAENAMPRDETGNVDKKKEPVMAALGEWIDDQKG